MLKVVYITSPVGQVVEGVEIPETELKDIIQGTGMEIEEINKTATLTYVRVVDRKKEAYNEKKRQKLQKVQKDKKVIKIGVSSASADTERKVKQAEELFSGGHPVQVEIQVKGRLANTHKVIAREVLERYFPNKEIRVEPNKVYIIM